MLLNGLLIIQEKKRKKIINALGILNNSNEIK